MAEISVALNDGLRIEKMKLTIEQLNELVANLNVAMDDFRRSKEVIVWFDFEDQTVMVETR